MATITTILSTDDGATSLVYINDNFLNLNTDKTEITYVDSEITALGLLKLGTGALRVGMANNWSMFYTNGTGGELAVALGTSGKVLTSNGVSSAPTFEVPTVSISGLTEDTVGDMSSDYLIKYDGTNKKILVNKYKATDLEATAGILQTKFIDPKQVKDNYCPLFGASDILKGSADTSRAVLNIGSYTKFKEITLPTTSLLGTIRVKADLTWTSGNNYFYKVYKNGVAIGSEHTGNGSTTFSDDIIAGPGDLIQGYAYNGSGVGSANILNFRVYYTNTLRLADNGTVSLD